MLESLREAYNDLLNDLVDPLEPFCDGGEAPWLPLGSGDAAARMLWSPEQHAAMRSQCRLLALTNEFAINGHENRISYIVGSGHTYRATVRQPFQADRSGNSSDSLQQLAADAQSIINSFLADNHWQRRQQEIVRRRDRDGEAFLRFFTAPDGSLRVRFIEPELVASPPGVHDAASFGIVTEPHDVETPLAYHVADAGVPASAGGAELIDAAEIQHRKANVDANVKRGLPLFLPIHKNLKRAEKLLRNMSTVAEIQSAIALIRKHRRAMRSGVEQFAADAADRTATDPASGKTLRFQRFSPGTIIDAYGNIDYDFPAAGLNASNYVAVLQAELRAIASRLVMPEFMLTSDASNANYSSTLIAEGPAMKYFERLQGEQIADDLAVMRRVLEAAVRADKLPRETLSLIEIQAAAPQLSPRDHLREAQVSRIEHDAGVLSLQTWSQRRGLDYDLEQASIAAHASDAPQ